MNKILLIIFIFTGQIVYSQQNTTIKITDRQTNECLPFSHICIENKINGKTEYITANKEGIANFQYSGKTIISVFFVGYQTIIDTIDVYQKNINYKLKIGNNNIDKVVVTGQNQAISIDNSIYNIKLIGSEKIELQASNNLSELLKNELNISINNDPSTGSSVKLQGVSGENVKILIDGVPVIGRMDGNVDLSQINLDNIDHIEIVEGPMSVIYGSNALAGVINIITKENKYAKVKTTIDTYYETVGTYNANGNIYLRNKKNNIGLNFGRNFFQGYSPDQNSRSKQWKPKEQYQTGFYYTYNNKNFKLKYKTDAFKERLLDRDNPQAPYFNKANDIWFNTIRLNNNLQTDYKFSEYSSFNLLLSYSFYDRTKLKYLKDLTNLETTISPNLSDHDTTIFNAYIARGVYDFNSSNKKISLQLGFDLNKENAQGKRIINKYEEMGDYAIFTSLQWKANERIVFQPAVRYSYNTKYKAPLTPSFNLKYKILKTNFRASYSRGFRAPSLKELYLYFYDSNHQIEGNDQLKAEKSHNYNIAITHKNIILKKSVEFRINGFYNKIQDVITLVQVDEENSLHYRNENIGKFESIGGTFSTILRPVYFLNISGGIAQTGSRDNYFDSKNFIFSTNANASTTLKLFKNTTTLSVFYKYIGKYHQYYYSNGELELGYINPYHNMDITFSQKFFKSKFTISGGIKNVFNNVNISGVGVGGESAHSSQADKLVGYGRTFFVGAKLNLSKY